MSLKAAREARAAAELAATRKEVKYADIIGRHMFEPIAVETLGVFNASAVRLLNDLGRRISSISGDTRETSHLYKRVSVLVQRFNAVLLHDSLPVPDCTDSLFSSIFKPPSGIDTESKKIIMFISYGANST